MRQAWGVRRPLLTTLLLALAYLGACLVGNTDSRRWLYIIVNVVLWVLFALAAHDHLRRREPRPATATRGGATRHGAQDGHDAGEPGDARDDRRTVRRPVLLVAALAALVQLPGLFFAPVASTDLNRYAWDGRVQAAGIDPYRYVPFDDRLAHLRDPILFPGLTPSESSGFTTEPLPTDRRKLLEYAKNYPDKTPMSRPRFPTPYPPVAEAYYTAVAAVSPWSWGTKPFQVAGAALAVATSALLALGLGRRALDALLFAWTPTAVMEAGQGGHVDILVAVLVVAAVLAARRLWHPVAVGALMGLAAGVKLTPFTMLPAFTPVRRFARSLVVGLVAIGLVVATYGPHYLAVGDLVTGSIGGYLTEENGENRASILALLLPTTVAAAVGSVITLAVAAWAVFARRDPDEPAWPALVLFSTLMLTTTPVLSWYCLPILALATLLRRWEFFALGVAGALAYGGHSYYPMTPIAYAAALLVIVLVPRLRRP